MDSRQILLLLLMSVVLLVNCSPCEASPLNSATYRGDHVHHVTGDREVTKTRIIGGSNARLGEFPWQVSLQRPEFGVANEFCGGAILNRTTIITAVHCFYDFDQNQPIPPRGVVAVAGVLDIANTDGNEQAIPVSSHRLHPSFNPTTFDYDIALLTLSSPLNFGTNVNSIRLATSDIVPSGKCTAVGWGETEDAGIPPGTILQKVELDIVTRSTCNALWTPHGNSITERMICGHKTEKATCNGDSGSGFICKNGMDDYLAGVVSWGQTDGSCIEIPELPSVFTNIAKFTSWIRTGGTTVH